MRDVTEGDALPVTDAHRIRVTIRTAQGDETFDLLRAEEGYRIPVSGTLVDVVPVPEPPSGGTWAPLVKGVDPVPSEPTPEQRAAQAKAGSTPPFLWTPADDEALGHPGGPRPYAQCTQCGAKGPVVVVGSVLDYESATACLCRPCVVGALALFDEAEGRVMEFTFAVGKPGDAAAKGTRASPGGNAAVSLERDGDGEFIVRYRGGTGGDAYGTDGVLRHGGLPGELVKRIPAGADVRVVFDPPPPTPPAPPVGATVVVQRHGETFTALVASAVRTAPADHPRAGQPYVAGTVALPDGRTMTDTVWLSDIDEKATMDAFSDALLDIAASDLHMRRYVPAAARDGKVAATIQGPAPNPRALSPWQPWGEQGATAGRLVRFDSAAEPVVVVWWDNAGVMWGPGYARATVNAAPSVDAAQAAADAWCREQGWTLAEAP